MRFLISHRVFKKGKKLELISELEDNYDYDI